MNAAIRAVVRTGVDLGWNVLGIKNGFAGLVNGQMSPCSSRDVSGIIDKGGTLLGSARCLEFQEESGRRRAIQSLDNCNVSGLIVIGGNGSQTGAKSLADLGVPVVGISSTIDNDLAGTDITIGVDTALNIALEAIDRLKVTASSHRRGFLIEVMGRKCGYIALNAAIAGGAEVVVIPEIDTTPEAIASELRDAFARGKNHGLAVVAEGAKYNAEALVSYFKQHGARTGFDLRATQLGHVQRGGAPTAFDRLLGTRFGAAAVETLARNKQGVLVGLIKGEITTTPYADVVGHTKPLDPELLKLANVLAK
jgi:6-phosphofructokinase 1